MNRAASNKNQENGTNKPSAAAVNIESYFEKINIRSLDSLLEHRELLISQGLPKICEEDYPENIAAADLYPKSISLVVSDIEDCGNAKIFSLSAANAGILPGFCEGQYVCLTLEIKGREVTRPYTLCSSSDEATGEGTWKIAVPENQSGVMSDYIFNRVVPGTALKAAAPAGYVYYVPLRDSKSIVAVISGSGASAALSLAKSPEVASGNVKLTVFYVCDKKEDIILKDKFDRIASKNSSFKIVYVLERDSDSDCESGFVTAPLIKRFIEDDDFTVFLYGGEGLYGKFLPEAEKLGLTRRRFRYELHSSSMITERDIKTYTIIVNTPDTRKSVSALSNEPLLTSLERSGIAAPNGCRCGKCGFCRTKLISGKVRISDKNDFRRESDKKAGYIHPCCTYPDGNAEISITCENGAVKKHTLNERLTYVNSIMSVVMAITVCVSATLLANMIVPSSIENIPVAFSLLVSVPVSVLICFALSMILPYSSWAAKLRRWLRADPGTLKYSFANGISIVLADSTVITIIISFFYSYYEYRKLPYELLQSLSSLWAECWIFIYPTVLSICLLVMTFVTPFVIKMAKLPAKLPPSQKKK